MVFRISYQKMALIIMKLFFYFLAQTIFTGYCLLMGVKIDGFFYMFLIGLGNIVVCFLIASRNRRALIVSILFYILIILFYAYLYFDMLIARGFINSSHPFFMMGDEIHAPVLLYCVIAIIFLGRYLRKKNKN